jgi:hypothetical protein
VFLIKKLKRKNQPEIFFNAMIKNIKVHNIFNIIEISKFMELKNILITNIYEYIYLNVSYKFFKLNGSCKIKM